MSITPSDGGSAFPIPEATGGIAPGFGGISVRDYFAGQVIAGIHANPEIAKFNEHFLSSKWAVLTMFAETAYQQADAMLKKRSEP